MTSTGKLQKSRELVELVDKEFFHRYGGAVNTFSILLYALAATAALWSLAGLFNPRALFFAFPEYQTRANAFFFPLRIAIPFAVIACMNTELASNITYNWGTSLGICLAFLWYAAKRAAVLRGYVE